MSTRIWDTAATMLGTAAVRGISSALGQRHVPAFDIDPWSGQQTLESFIRTRQDALRGRPEGPGEELREAIGMWAYENRRLLWWIAGAVFSGTLWALS